MSTQIAKVEGTVQKQVHLPFSTAWHISLQSIRTRLGRTMITASGILLGIAFFSAVITGRLFPMQEQGAAAVAARDRQIWLAIMALLVCFVGIMNSMLMSVTERFKEIGTMKCLGALNRFIITIFMIEAALMGVGASVLGWFLGWASIALVHLVTDGVHVFGADFWSGTLKQALLTIALGMGITLVAAIWPSVRAAAMPPAVALRTEV